MFIRELNMASDPGNITYQEQIAIRNAALDKVEIEDLPDDIKEIVID